MKKLFVCLTLALLPVPAFAQPYENYLEVPQGHGYIQFSLSNAFNFTNGVTFEGWVLIVAAESCGTILGRNFQTAYWIGVCGLTLRSQLRGPGSVVDGGQFPLGRWTHFAVTYDGTTRKHYINGEEVVSRPDTGPVGSSTSPFRLGSDIAWEISPRGAFDELRVWDVARTKEQIRNGINKPLNPPQTGLVGVFHLNNNAIESVSGERGTPTGTCVFNKTATASCTPAADTLCLHGFRFRVQVRWQTADGQSGPGFVVPGASDSSGLFWFFAPDNWELLVKALDGCSFNNRYWVFSAATTNVHYEMTVTDTFTGAAKFFLNTGGDDAIAITDTGAFTCP